MTQDAEEVSVSMPEALPQKTPATVDEQQQRQMEQTGDKEDKEGEYRDRYLEGTQRTVVYELLDARGKGNETTDPDFKRFHEAKALFKKSYDIAMTIPRSLEDDVLEQHEQDIKTAAETMVEAWLLDDKASSMSERVLILGQQYEKVLLKNVPEDEREGFYIKESLLFSVWILMVGRQHQHCLSTLNLAIENYNDLPARVYFFRASCYFSLNKVRRGLRDLETCLLKDPGFAVAYSVQGSAYMSLNERDHAIKAFRQCLQHGHPDTIDYSNALYALSILLSEKNKKSEAHAYYTKAKDADTRFQYLYGTKTGMNDTKRQAIQTHESPEDARKLILEAMPAKQYNSKKIEQLIQAGILNSPFKPSSKNCSSCGSKHLKDQPSKPLLCCGGCKCIWYCSRGCQITDFKAGHKVICKRVAAPVESKN